MDRRTGPARRVRTRLLEVTLVLGCATVLVGCFGTTVEFTKLNRPPHKLTPRPDKQVQIFARKAPTRPFTEVYLLEGDTALPEGSGELMDDLRAKAGQLGCDALLLSASTAAIGERAGVVGRAHQAVCIVYNEPAPPPPPSAP